MAHHPVTAGFWCDSYVRKRDHQPHADYAMATWKRRRVNASARRGDVLWDRAGDMGLASTPANLLYAGDIDEVFRRRSARP